jgi:hypothetical protein
MRTSRSHSPFSLSAAVLALLASVMACSVSFGADAVGEVADARGKSTGLLEGVARPLDAGASVFLDETLRTSDKARLALSLGPNTRLQLGERTQVRIDKALVDKGGELVLERGALLFDRNDAEKGASLTVRTPFGVIATRGTKFFVGPSRGATGVFVERGEVSVRTKRGQVALKAGDGTDLLSADLPPSPVKRWAPARIAEAMKSVN